MSAAMKSVVLAICLLGYEAIAQTQPPATRTPGFLTSFTRPMVNGGADAVNSGLGLVDTTVKFKTSMANRVGQGLTAAADTMTNMGIGMASDVLTFGTSAAARIADIGEALAKAMPLTPIGAAASTGAAMIRLGLNTIATGGNMLLNGVQQLSTTKHNIMSSGISKGTEFIANIGSNAVGAGQTGVTMGAEALNQVVAVADSTLGTGYNMVAQGVAMVNTAISQAGATMQGLAEQAKSTLDANIAATLPGASVSASQSGTTTTASGSASG